MTVNRNMLEKWGMAGRWNEVCLIKGIGEDIGFSAEKYWQHIGGETHFGTGVKEVLMGIDVDWKRKSEQ